MRAASALPEEAAVEQTPQPSDHEHESLVEPRGDDRRMKDAQVRREGFEAERAGGVGGVEQAPGVVDGERRRGRGEGVVVEQGETFAGRQIGVAEQAGGQIGQRRKVGLAERTELSHDGADAAVERLDQAFRQRGTHAGVAGGEPVRQAQHGGPHDVACDRHALSDPMVLEQATIEARHFGGSQRHPFEHAHAGRQAVDLVAALKGRLDRAPGMRHALPDVGRKGDGFAVARHAHELVERQRRAGKDDRHRTVIARRRYPKASSWRWSTMVTCNCSHRRRRVQPAPSRAERGSRLAAPPPAGERLSLTRPARRPRRVRRYGWRRRPQAAPRRVPRAGAAPCAAPARAGRRRRLPSSARSPCG